MNAIEGQTNVRTSRFGSGSVKGIGREVGKFIVTTMDIPWEITRDKIGGTPEDVVIVDSVEQTILDEQLSLLPEFDTVFGIGGGKAVDAAKYFAWKRGARLVTIPTILSVDAFVTPAAGVRVNHEVVYLGETSPDPLIIDYDVIRTAPQELNVAGIGDLLSIHTATYDWELAFKRDKTEYTFSTQAVEKARGILDDLYKVLPDIKEATDTGLRTIVEGFMRLNTICLPAGHYRVEEGSEHFLFYELEERLQQAFIHGHIVGLGIYLMSRLQNNQPAEITRMMDEVKLAYHPMIMKIRKQDLRASLKNLRSYVRSREHLWYTIIDDVEITDEWIEAVLADLKF